MSNTELLTLARAVLARNQPKTWDSAWDSRGTAVKMVSQGIQVPGTVKTEIDQSDNLSVPLSHALGCGTVGQSQNPGTVPGTVAGHPYSVACAALRNCCPDFVDEADWQQAITDSNAFLPAWGAQAIALRWSEPDLFGLHSPLDRPSPSYRRLSRVDCTGLIWLLHGRAVIAMTTATATIRAASGSQLVYRKEAPQC